MLLTRVIARVEPGGAQLAVIRLTAALETLGVDSRLLVGEATPDGRRMLVESGADFELWRPDRGTLQYGCDPAFAAWLRPRLAGAEIVHAHMFGAWWAAAEALEGSVPLIASEHNAVRWPGRPRLDEMRRALARVDACLAHSDSAASLFRSLGLPARRLHRASSPIEVPTAHVTRRLPRPRLIFAGRLHPEKGPDVLIEALARLARPVPAYLLGSGPLARSLRRRAAALGLAETVALVGWQPRIGPWLSGAAACVVPSRHEAWSQTAVTAMAHRVPVIGTAVEGLPATLAESRGLLVPAEDPERLAGAMSAVIAGNVEVDLTGAQRYASRFTPEAVAASCLSVYTRLLAPNADLAAAA
jgi:glycosyltransferase involved in cell wall biosynthesis